MKIYLIAYLGSLVLAVLLTPLVMYIARVLNIFDDHNARKVHAKAIPRIGGGAIVLSMLGVIVPVLIFHKSLRELPGGIQPKIIVLLAAGVFIFLVGLIDDMCRLRARSKFLAQFAAAVVVCAFGIRIEYITLADWFTLTFGWFSWPLTIFWIVGITNAVNLIDGLDGLAAGISGIACAVIAVFALYTGQLLMAVLMLALLGSLCGFLFYNFNPARIFMGDSGSLFLGFILAGSSVLCATKSATIVGLALPTLALGIPIFDTLFSMLRRFLERRPIFTPDRSHLHHKLLDMGLHQRHVVVLIYFLTASIAGLGMFMMATRNAGSLIIFGCGLVLLLLFFRILGAVRLRETISHLQRKRYHFMQAQEHQSDFARARCVFHQVDTFNKWWQAVQEAGQLMECMWMVLTLQARSGTKKTMLWRREGEETDAAKLLEVTLPVKQRRKGPENSGLRLNLAFKINGSLEAAGNRAALFSRLIEENSVGALPCLEPERRYEPEQVDYGLETSRIQEIMAPAKRQYSPVS